MKLRIYLLLVFCLVLQMFSSAQQYRFLYIQTENRQPFYVNLNNNILSSSASGYLIIPRLQEGTYQLTIGFPKNEWPRQVITYSMGKKDEGVLLKNYGGQGWGFQNLQNSETTMAAANKPRLESTADEDNDSFTQILSEVVNTPDLKIKTKDVDPVPAVVSVEPIVAKTPDPIRRLSENRNEQGQEFVYIDNADTISIFIPATVAPVVQVLPIKEDNSLPAKETTAVEDKPVVSQVKATEEKPVIMETKLETPDPVSTPITDLKEDSRPSSIRMINSDCKSNASDDDFMKLRKKMAAEENEVKMVVVAKKAFKSKCYNTLQIKNLSVLFLNDSGRFQFFENAYPFVSDSNNFSGLQAQLTDPYYLTRFQSLLHR